ncbi:MAG TPA: fibronectin type III domain-containing protein, partial [Pyrinomonadaceae bacterium]|nr:fibronectin type III domain-containing protein [Pyrinomonadaceae bacterium]
REIEPEALADPNIDIVSSHHYPSPNRSMLEDVERFERQIGGKKVYILGEVGFVPVKEFREILDAVIRKNISGAMLWSLRYHNRDGGFYWHSEPAGGLLYKAYHYPGFETGAAYAETELISLVREKAFEIRGLAVPPLPRPDAPVLLPAKSASAISWRGSVGAMGYDVERSFKPKGPWAVVGAKVDDTFVQYRPLFADESAEPGHNYYYRVVAKNSTGASPPSNVAGPVRVEEHVIVDELSDYSRTFAHGGAALSLETTNPRPYKEDAHRLKGSDRDWVTYRSTGSLRSARVMVFMEDVEKDFEFYLSQDGEHFTKVEPEIKRFPVAVNPYGYKLPVQYEIAGLASGTHFLKVVFRTEAQVSRVELRDAR